MLESKIDMMEQQVRQSNIEIVNLPERRDENLIAVLQNIGSIIKHPINPADIVSVHRVPHMDKKNPHPKNVIVKFSTKIIRDNVIAAARVVKSVKSDQLLISDIQSKHKMTSTKVVPHIDRELDLSNTGRGVWLVKVPKYIANKWEKAPGNIEVGKLKISRVSGQRAQVQLSLSQKQNRKK
ncbi:unnamed protein product [Parnassius apollo]|uniref:(apollo) hypothetical protein n=1 Tax=Parnassius apollo TaxID=110799 RepID=A0A8S3X3K9_PARAO|nr:unnamed protein product [Parnassius apollo]